MFAALSRAVDSFRGSGAAAVTIPSLDGAFRPNQRLEEAAAVLEIAAPDNLAVGAGGTVFSSGPAVFALKDGAPAAAADRIADFGTTVASLDVSADGGMAVGLANKGIVLHGGAHHGKHLTAIEGRSIVCPTALRFVDAGTLILCLGSQQNDPAEWKRDLLDGRASGSVWRVDLGSNRGTCLADGLAWPGGVVQPAPGRVVIAESWRHQLVELANNRATPLLTDIPGYPSRLVPATGGGSWLAVFAPRSQLVEFVLRERRFRERMMREVEPEFWVAPSLHHTVDYREPLQSGAVKQLGELKPWSPSRSYGLVVLLDDAFNPVRSFHSRANGKRHGVTSCVETGERLLATSNGGNVVLGIDLVEMKESTP